MAYHVAVHHRRYRPVDPQTRALVDLDNYIRYAASERLIYENVCCAYALGYKQTYNPQMARLIMARAWRVLSDQQLEDFFKYTQVPVKPADVMRWRRLTISAIVAGVSV